MQSSTSAFIGLGPIHVPDQALWLELVLPLALVRELDCEWLVVCISLFHLVSSHL